MAVFPPSKEKVGAPTKALKVPLGTVPGNVSLGCSLGHADPSEDPVVQVDTDESIGDLSESSSDHAEREES